MSRASFMALNLRRIAWSLIGVLVIFPSIAGAHHVSPHAISPCHNSLPIYSPQLNTILPRGVQRGQEHVLTFSGVRLQETQEVFLYTEGVTVKKIEQIDDKNVKVTVDVAADCRLGEHIAQLRTAFGISEFKTFFVGALPEVTEVEPNSDFANPQVIEHNVTVTGVIDLEDVDYYQISATKGQRISLEIEAIRLGTQLIDPYLAVLNEKQFEIFAEDDTRLLKQDCFISFVAPEDATYTILVRDSAYGGNGNSHYRLHVGHFPRPVIAWPAGGCVGTETNVELLGDPTGPIPQTISLTESGEFREGIFYQDDLGITPSPVAFRVTDLPNEFEVEPNQGFDKATPVPVPCAMNGILQDEKDHDWFCFECQKDQTYDVEVFAQRVGSPVDAVLHIWGTDRKRAEGNDDSRGTDSHIRFTATADGTYFLRVRDLLDRGGEQFIYRVEISQPQPSLTIGIPPAARFSQYRQSIFVPRGNRFATLISAQRTDFEGGLKLLSDNLPPGVQMHAMPMADNLNQMPVVFEAAEDAEIQGQLVDLIASHVEEASPIQGGFYNSAMLVRGPPNNTQYVGCEVDRVPIAVIEPLPFKIEIEQPKVPLVREGNIDIKVNVLRDEGFDGPITLQFPFRSPGVGTHHKVKIPNGESEAIYPLNANGNAQIREWPIVVIASSNINGQAWTSSQLATLEVAERFVTFDIARAACEQGEETQFVCQLNHITPFEGNATAELLGLPPHAEVETLEFDQATEQLVFTVKTTAETPVGKHSGVFCRVHIPIADESVVATAGYSELQIHKPLPKATVKSESEEPKPAEVETTAAEKPLSRLEKLRQSVRNKDGDQ